jgi:hypothetical protein
MFLNFVLAGTLVVSAYGQISQDRPDLCGKPNETLPIPSGITAVSTGEKPVLSVALAGSQAKVRINADRVDQVCPIAGSRLVVFGSLSEVVWDVAIINVVDGRVLDEFWTYNPSISPDQRWLVFRDFYPFTTDVTPSDQYLLYDLRKDAAGNRIPLSGHAEAAGETIYPAVPNHVPFNNLGVPDDQIHQFRSDAFYWKPDSSSVIFADEFRGQVSIILVKTGEDEEPAAFIRNVSVAEVCGGNTAPREALLELKEARVVDAVKEPSGILVKFGILGDGCQQHDLVLHSDEFRPAQVEITPRPTKRHPAVRAK